MKLPVSPETLDPQAASCYITDMDDELLTITEAARLLNVERNTLTAWRTRGKMPQPDQTWGRTPLWHKSTLLAWRKPARNKIWVNHEGFDHDTF